MTKKNIFYNSKQQFINIKPNFNFKKQHSMKPLNDIIVSRNAKITPLFIGLTVRVYNGKELFDITIVDDMIKHKFGEFVFTRKPCIYKARSKNKQKQQKAKKK